MSLIELSSLPNAISLSQTLANETEIVYLYSRNLRALSIHVYTIHTLRHGKAQFKRPLLEGLDEGCESIATVERSRNRDILVAEVRKVLDLFCCSKVFLYRRVSLGYINKVYDDGLL